MIDLVKVLQSDHRFAVRTEGLRASGCSEISIDVDASLLEESERFLKYASDYISGAGKHIKPGETMAYGYWLVKFREAEQGDYLETWEYSADASMFVKGGDLTLGYWRDQHFVCDLHKARFSPPRPDRLTVVSAGVMEGLAVQGIRYPSPGHMSGWWITTDLYDGNIKSLRHEHTYHVTAARPDLAQYLALPDGFRFNLSVAEVVWFDEKVLEPAQTGDTRK
jgi:hypothetical protein